MLNITQNNIFFDILDQIPQCIISEKEANLYINKLLNKNILNNYIFSELDYEKLITIEYLFPDNQDIQNKIIKIKKLIANYYVQKQKLINKMK